MRIVPVVSVLILTLVTSSAFARRSRCRQVVCEGAPVVCCSAAVCIKPACVKPTTVCCTPQPTTMTLEEKAVPVAATAPVEEKAISIKRPKQLLMQEVDAALDAYLAGMIHPRPANDRSTFTPKGFTACGRDRDIRGAGRLANSGKNPRGNASNIPPLSSYHSPP